MSFERICQGIYLEGLCADITSVWVSDPIQGGIRHIRADGTTQAWLPEKRWIGGLLLNANGALLISGEGGIIWLDGVTGTTGILIDKVNDKPLPGVNEMVCDDHGGIYFGSLDVAAIAAGRASAAASLYHMAANGHVREVRSGLKFSNGLGISPDGRRLYHNETFVGVSAYDIEPDGTLGQATFLLEKPDCDGLTVDSAGTLWITGCRSSAVTCLRPDGSLKELFETPGGGATCVKFGGIDRRDLYVNTVGTGAAEQLKAGIWPTTEESVLYRTRSDVAGLAHQPNFNLQATEKKQP